MPTAKCSPQAEAEQLFRTTLKKKGSMDDCQLDILPIEKSPKQIKFLHICGKPLRPNNLSATAKK